MKCILEQLTVNLDKGRAWLTSLCGREVRQDSIDISFGQPRCQQARSAAMKYSEYAPQKKALDDEQYALRVRHVQDEHTAFDARARELARAGERRYTIPGSERTVHVIAGGRWIHLQQGSSCDTSTATSQELLAFAIVRGIVEMWQAGEIDDLPPEGEIDWSRRPRLWSVP